jgi:hypothetical protein
MLMAMIGGPGGFYGYSVHASLLCPLSGQEQLHSLLDVQMSPE